MSTLSHSRPLCWDDSSFHLLFPSLRFSQSPLFNTRFLSFYVYTLKRFPSLSRSQYHDLSFLACVCACFQFLSFLCYASHSNFHSPRFCNIRFLSFNFQAYIHIKPVSFLSQYSQYYELSFSASACLYGFSSFYLLLHSLRFSQSPHWQYRFLSFPRACIKTFSLPHPE